MDLVSEHCERLAKANVDGMMLSWSLRRLSVAQSSSWHNSSLREPLPNASTALQVVGRSTFWTSVALRLFAAWTQFSRASGNILQWRPSLQRSPALGPANLLYCRQPISATMGRVEGGGGDFPSAIERLRRSLSATEVLRRIFQEVADGWGEVLLVLEAAQSHGPADRPCCRHRRSLRSRAPRSFILRASRIRLVSSCPRRALAANDRT